MASLPSLFVTSIQNLRIEKKNERDNRKKEIEQYKAQEAPELQELQDILFKKVQPNKNSTLIQDDQDISDQKTQYSDNILNKKLDESKIMTTNVFKPNNIKLMDKSKQMSTNTSKFQENFFTKSIEK